MESIPEPKVKKQYKKKPIEEKKTADPKKYIREYKKKQYQEQTEKFKEYNRISYYKYKYNLSPEEMTLYGSLVPDITKALSCLRNIRQQNPSLLHTVLERFAKEPDEPMEKITITEESVPIELLIL